MVALRIRYAQPYAIIYREIIVVVTRAYCYKRQITGYARGDRTVSAMLAYNTANEAGTSLVMANVILVNGDGREESYVEIRTYALNISVSYMLRRYM